MVMNEGEWLEWARSRGTRAFLAQLQDTEQETLVAWGNGAYIAETGQETLQYNAKALGGLDMLKQVIKRIQELQEQEQ